MPVICTAEELPLSRGADTTSTDDLINAKEAAAFLNMTPYVPTPAQFTDTIGADAVLASTPYAPTPDMTPLPPTPGEPSQPLPTPGAVMAEWIEHTKACYRRDPRFRQVMHRHLLDWVLDMYERSLTAQDEGWRLSWADAIREAVANERRDRDALERAANAMGLTVIPIGDKSSPKRSSTKIPEDKGKKKAHAVSLPPSAAVVEKSLPPCPLCGKTRESVVPPRANTTGAMQSEHVDDDIVIVRAPVPLTVASLPVRDVRQLRKSQKRGSKRKARR
jgi:hypothetical protein